MENIKQLMETSKQDGIRASYILSDPKKIILTNIETGEMGVFDLYKVNKAIDAAIEKFLRENF